MVGEELGLLGIAERIGIVLQAYYPGASGVGLFDDAVLHIHQ